MNRFENQLSRMQSLMNYGMVSESDNKNGNIEFSKIGADGKSYGIIRECNKYYIKVADADKATISEAYNYIGGFNNKKAYEYDGYYSALKNFDLKMMSLNEAHECSTNATSLDPSKKEDLVIEGTDKMKAELARQRQIMANAANIISEGSIPGCGCGANAGAPYGEKNCCAKEEDVKDSIIPSDGKSVATQVGEKERPDAKYDGKELKEECECPSCEFGDENVIEDDTTEDEDFEISDEDILPSDDEMEDAEESEDEIEDEPMEDEIPTEEPVVEPEDNDVEARIAELEAELAELKASIAEDEVEDEEEPVEDDKFEVEEEPSDNEEIEDEEEFVEGPVEDDEFDAEDDLDECGMQECGINEAKARFMNSIVESVVRQIVEEDELHDFGNHPGYRKKVMSLPPTGSDNENGMRDWNDASVHSELPFGQKPCVAKPYTDPVKIITDSIMDALKKKM